MRIVVVAGDPAAGSARVRLGQLVPHWRAAGHEVVEHTWDVHGRAELAAATTRLALAARRADAVIVQKPSQAPWVLRAAVPRRTVLAIDIDDAVWVGAAGERTAASGRRDDRLLAAAAGAQVVVTGSRWLAAHLDGVAPEGQVHVIGSALDPEAYAGSTASRSSPAELCWVGSAGNLRDLHADFRAGVGAALAASGGVLHVICDVAPELGALPVRWSRWSASTEIDLIAGATIGVMPLVDDERSRGRCSYKAVQCMAAGLPVIASPVGGATEVVREGETGRWATDAGSWQRAVTALLDDPSARAALAAAGRAEVAAHHDAAIAADRWLELLAAAAW